MNQQHSQGNRGRRRKVAAILAGGVVVGVGTMATLAAWTDTEYATGTFTGGYFDLRGSTDQTTFSDHTTAGSSATLSFTAPVTQMSPNDVVYAPYALNLYKTSTNAGTVVVSAPSTTGTVTNLTYSLFTTSTAGCNASSTVLNTIVAAGTAVGSVGTPATITVAKPANSSTDGVPTYLCFKVTAGAGLVQ
ncbi:MAG: SipW-dependent-type signal peptide-containing protein, partial [Propionibacteriales bacterium]|nr:SipW-dependent-type signal peptide-containing protein [Propionibacteriales bacterium]